MTYRLTSPVTFTGTGFVNFSNINIFQFVTTAAGDLIYGLANQQLARLAVGTNNQVLTVINAANGSINWANAAADVSNTSATVTKNANLSVSANTNTNVNSWVVNATLGDYNDLSSFDLATGVFNCQTAGKYDLWTQLEFANNDNSGERRVQVMLNGPTSSNTAVLIATQKAQPTPDTSINYFVVETAAAPTLQVNDLVFVQVFQSSASTLQLNNGAQSRLYIQRIA